MKFQIKDVSKAYEFIELIKFIKNLSSDITCQCVKEHIYIQVMDSSHVCLVDIYIPKNWFHMYETSNITFSMKTAILAKIVAMYTLDSIIECFIDENDADNIHIKLIHDKQQKIFEVPLMDIEKDVLAPKTIDTNLDFIIKTKLLEKYISELSQFGEILSIECKDDKIYFGTKSIEEGTINIEIKNECLEEFNVVEDYTFKGLYFIKYLQYITKLCSIYTNIHLYLDETNPLMITFEKSNEEKSNITIQYFIAPNCSDE
jgi:proliferating cell nuclear antigen PCNA